MRLPGRCIICRTPVIWTGKSWRNGGRGKGRRHECPPDRATCGAWMPVARERCARRPHTFDPDRGGGHRTAYALENQARAKASEHHIGVIR